MAKFNINYYDEHDERCDIVVEASDKYAAKALCPSERINVVAQLPNDAEVTFPPAAADAGEGDQGSGESSTSDDTQGSGSDEVAASGGEGAGTDAGDAADDDASDDPATGTVEV